MRGRIISPENIARAKYMDGIYNTTGPPYRRTDRRNLIRACKRAVKFSQGTYRTCVEGHRVSVVRGIWQAQAHEFFSRTRQVVGEIVVDMRFGHA